MGKRKHVVVLIAIGILTGISGFNVYVSGEINFDQGVNLSDVLQNVKVTEVHAPADAVPVRFEPVADELSYENFKSNFEQAHEIIREADILGWKSGIFISGASLGGIPAGEPAPAIMVGAATEVPYTRSTSKRPPDVKIVYDYDPEEFVGYYDNMNESTRNKIKKMVETTLPFRPAVTGLETNEVIVADRNWKMILHKKDKRIYAHIVKKLNLFTTVHAYACHYNDVTPAGWNPVPVSGVQNASMRLSDAEIRKWKGLIGICGLEGQMFNPNLPHVKIAKGVAFGPSNGTYIVFAAYPDIEEAGRALVLVYETNCDFLKNAQEGKRGCEGYWAYVFNATDEGVLLRAFQSSAGSLNEWDITEPAIQQRFINLRQKFIEMSVN